MRLEHAVRKRRPEAKKKGRSLSANGLIIRQEVDRLLFFVFVFFLLFGPLVRFVFLMSEDRGIAGAEDA